MSEHLNREIQKVKNSLATLSTLVEESFQNAIKAYLTLDSELAESVIAADEEIDVKEVDVEEDCLKILALHRPVARDLRMIVSILKINNDLERIGDLASNLASRTIKISHLDSQESLVDFNVMFQKSRMMLKKSLDALVNVDVALARAVLKLDDEVDELKNELRDQIRELLVNNPKSTPILMHNLSIVYYLERIGDLSTNIAEDVIYLEEGTIIRHKTKELPAS